VHWIDRALRVFRARTRIFEAAFIPRAKEDDHPMRSSFPEDHLAEALVIRNKDPALGFGLGEAVGIRTLSL
jgi:hypothetical protein